MTAEDPVLVFFAIETSDYGDDCDVLQIYMKCGESEFNKYINPTKQVANELTLVNHLRVRDSKLYRNAKEKRTWPLDVVLKYLLDFLNQFGRPCTLIAHRYCYFSSIQLLRVIKKEKLEMEFKNVIAGFTETLELFQKKFPGRKPDQLTIYDLAKPTSIKWESSFIKGRSIKNITNLLQQVLPHHFTPVQLTAKRSFSDELTRLITYRTDYYKKKRPPKKKVHSGRTRKGDWFFILHNSLIDATAENRPKKPPKY